MDKKLTAMLDASQDVHIPIPIDEEETAESRLVQKEVLKSRLIDDMESLDHWVLIKDYSISRPEPLADKNDLSDREEIRPAPTMELSSERCVCGTHSLKFTHPTNLDHFVECRKGRIYAQPSVKRVVDREDWSEYNRLSAWIYPIVPGMKSITLRMQLHNDGVRKMPEKWERDGAHNMALKGNQWNHVVLEMPYLDRDCVTGVSFDYDMVGHENDAADHVTWFIDQLELQQVKCDVYEGWIPAEDRISYSHKGYQPGGEKIAIASGIEAKTFKLIETATGKVVFRKEILTAQTKIGTLQVMDFSEYMEEGEYILSAGDLTTRVFAISSDVWESSVWKVLNFFLVLRCGYEVPGKHRACHTDMLLKHGDQAIVANGGWHDAADLAQGLINTTEATAALLELAEALKTDGSNDRLYRRVLEEAKWGLDYVLKMRFEGGWRGTYSSSSIWTDGVIGTNDDITTDPARSSYTNFDAAYTEAVGARVFEKVDPVYAAYALKIAKDDFHWGLTIYREQQAQHAEYEEGFGQFTGNDAMDLQVAAVGAMAAAELYRRTNEDAYVSVAKELGAVVMDCQQQEFPDWDVPMVGFFYQDTKRDLISHHAHMSFAHLPEMAMQRLCETFPDADEYMKWYNALSMSGAYYKKIASYTYPYGVIPAGVYHENEAIDHPNKTFASQIAVTAEECAADYAQMVREGFPLGKGYYLRVYPVWFSFRGNYNVLLSENKAMLAGAKYRNDYDLYAATQHNYEWIIGKNPMAQSTMVGEGYDFIQHYTVQPGQTTGSITVGMESHYEKDEPYWPQVNTATYKEVWVCPACKWMWCMADSLLPAHVSGYLRVVKNAALTFTHQATKKVYAAPVHERTGYYELTLPAGKYKMRYDDMVKDITVISGNRYTFDGALYDVKAEAVLEGTHVTLTVTAKGECDIPIRIKTDNVTGMDVSAIVPIENGEGRMVFHGELTEANKPFVGLVIPNNDLSEKVEFSDPRLG